MAIISSAREPTPLATTCGAGDVFRSYFKATALGLSLLLSITCYIYIALFLPATYRYIKNMFSDCKNLLRAFGVVRVLARHDALFFRKNLKLPALVIFAA